jgi:DNA-binding response OmpR family regulator
MSETAETRDADNKTILIVEDSSTQALHLQVLLEQEELNVVLAHDGRLGLQMAQQLHPDLVVLDVQMPEMNGFQVCQQLKKARETADIPVIMFTRHDEHESVILGLQTGAVDYIPKDAFADAVLLETLRQMGFIAES